MTIAECLRSVIKSLIGTKEKIDLIEQMNFVALEIFLRFYYVCCYKGFHKFRKYETRGVR